MSWLRDFLAVAGLCVNVAGCSADAVEEPLPALHLPGTFVVRENDDGSFRLYRTRTAIAFTPERTFLFMDEHPSAFDGVEDGRLKARDHDLVLVPTGPWLLTQFTKSPYWIVWYRSLTDEERGTSGI
jgi:hypothetical protein